jgi:hypothetical protein
MKVKEKKSDTILPIVIIILLAIVLLYLITFGKVNLLSDDSEIQKRKLEDRKKLVDQQYLKIEKILEKKKGLKQKLDKINRNILLGARLFMTLLFWGVSLVLKSYFQLSVLDLTGYVGLLLLIITFIAFIVFGSPSHAIEFWNYIEKKLTIKIYGKYINLQNHFERHEKQKLALNEESDFIQTQINEIKQAEEDVLKALWDGEII